MRRSYDDRGAVARYARWVAWVCAAAAFAMVWYPEFRANWASPLLVSADMVARGRQVPAAEVLESISSQSLGMSLSNSGALGGRGPAVVSMANTLLAGEVTFPRQPTMPIKVPFDASNLVAGPPTHQLYVASLATADVLLSAFHQTGNAVYFKAAQAEIVAFAHVDRWRLLPVGLLWNDHALAASVAVLVDYWNLVRGRADLDASVARDVLSLVARTGTRLARSENFTFRTNHGMMQSIALLQIAEAFPYLDDAERFRAIACGRIKEQLEYYVSPEGPVLEHSAGYHMLGFRLLQILDEHLARGSCPMPPGFAEKMERARLFAAELRRPDGSLPTYGNTDRGDRVSSDMVGIASPPTESGVYPASGFAIRWHGLPSWPDASKLAQTAVTWSNFPSRAHKLADDMSVVVWAAGEEWLSNTGYWPYGWKGERAAVGWRGSNAPHWAGEAADSPRKTVLRGEADSDRAWVVDLERTGLGGSGGLRRQVLAIDGHLWVIADWATEPFGASRIETLWTSTPGKRVSRLADGDFLVRSAASGRAARLVVLGASGDKTNLVQGSASPFGGWTVHDGVPIPTAAVETGRVPRTSPPMVTVLAIGNSDSLETAGAPTLGEASSAGDWSVTLPASFGATRVEWDGKAVLVAFPDGARRRLPLVPAPEDAERQRESIVAAYELTASRHERFPDLLKYRYRVTWIFIALLLGQEALVRLVQGRAPRFATALQIAASGAWLALGFATAFIYLVR